MKKRKPTEYTPFNPQHPKFIDMTGQRFGRLTVIRVLGRPINSTARYPPVHWLCKCDCGNEYEANGSTLRVGSATSCGCFHQEAAVTNNTTHGMSKTKEYVAYCEAKKRCTYPKHNRFDKYGGRGIEFRFESFEQFFSLLGKKPSPKHSLNRIDNDGHYEPGNVEWATATTQTRNQSRNRLITINGVTKTMTEWCNENGVGVGVADSRWRRQFWCQPCAVTLPNWHSCPHVSDDSKKERIRVRRLRT